jgi:hypothetical protein
VRIGTNERLPLFVESEVILSQVIALAPVKVESQLLENAAKMSRTGRNVLICPRIPALVIVYIPTKT